MKLLQSLLILLCLVDASMLQAEMYQLETVKRKEVASLLEDLSPAQLVEKEQARKFVISFVKATLADKLQMTTDDFKKKRGQVFLKSMFEKESYDKIDFQEIKLNSHKGNRLINVKANVYWFTEGYEGIQTYYFMLIKVEERWRLDWIIQ